MEEVRTEGEVEEVKTEGELEEVRREGGEHVGRRDGGKRNKEERGKGKKASRKTREVGKNVN